MRSKLRRPHVTLADMAAAIALVALALRWPAFAFPVGSLVFATICDRVGLSVAWALCLAVAAGVVVGLGLGTIATHR